MLPVLQTITTSPGGDCFRACVASILEVPIEETPHFLKDAKPGEKWTQAQWDALCAFADSHGYQALWLSVDTNFTRVPDLERSGLYYVATGIPAGCRDPHCVVMRGGVVEHDPLGLPPSEFPDGPFLWVYFVVKPSRNL